MFDKNIPIPKVKGRGRGKMYHFDLMEIGDSIFFNTPRENVAQAINRIGKSTGFRFTTRKENGGIRVWRIK